MMPSLFWIAFSFALILMTESSANAYVDPGSGSMLLQLILGGVGSVFLAIKGFRKRFFRKK